MDATHMFWICLKAQESDWKAVWHLLCRLLPLSEARLHDDHFHYEWSAFLKWFISPQQPDAVTGCPLKYFMISCVVLQNLSLFSAFLCYELICSYPFIESRSPMLLPAPDTQLKWAPGTSLKCCLLKSASVIIIQQCVYLYNTLKRTK